MTPGALLLGGLVVHACWQATLVAGVVVTLRPWLARQSAEVRYAVAYIALLLMLALPLLSSLVWAPSGASVVLSPAVALWAGDLWSIGALVNGLRLGASWAVARRLVLTAAEDAELTALVQRMADRMGVDAVVVGISHTLQGPAVVGVLRPVLLIPSSLHAKLALPELQALVAHELAHLKRFDPVMNAVQRVVEALLFFHPAMWWLSSVVDAEREHCADDAALAAGVAPGSLARALERVASSRLPVSVGLPASGGLLLHRVQRILLPGTPSRWPGCGPVGRALAGAMFAFILVSPFSHSLHPTVQQSTSLVAWSQGANPGEQAEELENGRRRPRPHTDEDPEWRTRLAAWGARLAWRALGSERFWR